MILDIRLLVSAGVFFALFDAWVYRAGKVKLQNQQQACSWLISVYHPAHSCPRPYFVQYLIL
jgi:hypothetical protein